MDQKLSTRDIALRGVVAAACAVGANLTIAFGFASLLGVSPDFFPLQLGPVAVATVVPVFLGTAVFALLQRFAKRPRLSFTVIAAIVSILSLMSSLQLSMDSSGAIPGTTPEAALSLIPLHVVPAAILVLFIATNRRSGK